MVCICVCKTLGMEIEDCIRDQLARRNALRRTLRDASNPFDIPALQFKQLYRISQELALRLLMQTENQLATVRENAVPPVLQLFIALRFYAQGSYQRGGSQDLCHPVSQSTVSRILSRVTDVIVGLSSRYIRWPKTPEERHETQARWIRLMEMPGILAAIDCTHIRICKPSIREESYLNYKRFHSLNVQMACDARHLIMNVRIGAGATNDKTVWSLSHLKQHLEEIRQHRTVREREGKFYIIGNIKKIQKKLV